jgi:hypothetical protein
VDVEAGNPARWARDPTGRHELRYWNGSEWTEHVSDAGVPSTDPPVVNAPIPESATPPSAAWTAPTKDRSLRAVIAQIKRWPLWAKIVVPVAIVVVVVALAIGASSSDNGASGGSLDAFSPTVTITYEVDGSAPSADITYETPSGISQQNGVDVPLTRTSDGGLGIRFNFVAGDFVSISAQNGGGGTITCRIRADGRVIAENTASGQYAIASCDGTA